jgi:hypothetical protein
MEVNPDASLIHFHMEDGKPNDRINVIGNVKMDRVIIVVGF